MKKILPLLLICLFMTSSSYAYTSISQSCGSVIDYDNEDSDFAKVGYAAYMHGYITARSYELNVTLENETDAQSLYHAVVKFCRDNPLKDTDDAAQDIYTNLR